MARRSMGGQAVDTSLAQLGFDTARLDVAMVETQRPQARPFSAVLAQNAWNVIPTSEFSELLRNYPPKMQARIVARRAVALINLKRAKKVVALTEYMAEACERAVRREVEVVPIVRPLELPIKEASGGDPAVPTQSQPYALVPGTITWYKNPMLALRYVSEMQEEMGVLFAGIDDGSGCRADLEAKAEELGVDVRFEVFSRTVMPAVYSAAQVVVLPSRLESLGFALAEALEHSHRVVASGIPAHLEVARRLGYELESQDLPGALAAASAGAHDPEDTDVSRPWVDLGRALELERIGT